MHFVTQFLIDPLREYPEIAIFLTLALGFWFGGLKFRFFSLRAVTSTLIAGLLVGQLQLLDGQAVRRMGSPRGHDSPACIGKIKHLAPRSQTR